MTAILRRNPWFNWHLSPIKHERRGCGACQHEHHVTEQHTAERALRESEERFRTTMDNHDGGLPDHRQRLAVIYINKTAERHNRRPHEELIGKRYNGHVPGIESTAVFEVSGAAWRNEPLRPSRNEFAFPDGSDRLVST